MDTKCQRTSTSRGAFTLVLNYHSIVACIINRIFSYVRLRHQQYVQINKFRKQLLFSIYKPLPSTLISKLQHLK